MSESQLAKYIAEDSGCMVLSDGLVPMLDLDAGSAWRRAIGYGHLREVVLLHDGVEVHFSTGTYTVTCLGPERVYEALVAHTVRVLRVTSDKPKTGSVWVRAITPGTRPVRTAAADALTGRTS